MEQMTPNVLSNWQKVHNIKNLTKTVKCVILLNFIISQFVLRYV